MRQRQIRFLLRHQGCCQAHLRFLKVRVVLQRRRKELLRLVELILLPMDLSQFVHRVGIARILLQFLLQTLHRLRSVLRDMVKLPAGQQGPADAVVNHDR